MNSRQPTPIEAIRGEAGGIPGLGIPRLPRRWEKIGDVLLVRLPREVFPWRDAIAPIYARALGAKTVVEALGSIHGPWRIPEVRRLWGDGTETVHVENGVRFKLDVANVMFSSGNLVERMRMSRIVQAGETVVDLFAGIGYFSIPIAVHARPARVIACEVNPTAFRYLEENVALNRAGAVEARLGDCEQVAPEGIADRVIMGHFDSLKYLPVALRAAKDRAVIHMHALLSRPAAEGPPRRPSRESDSIFRELQREAVRGGFETANMTMRRVKGYGPCRVHVVVDADVVRTGTKGISRPPSSGTRR